MSHTPGPWKIERVSIQSSGGSNTCYKIGPFSACIYDDWQARRVGVSEEENLGNANLIAAAPELLEVLKSATDAHADGCGHTNGGKCTCWQSFRLSAILKAEPAPLTNLCAICAVPLESEHATLCNECAAYEQARAQEYGEQQRDERPVP